MFKILNVILGILSLIKSLYESSREAYKIYKERQAENKAKAQDKATVDEALSKIQKPIDETKTKEQRDKDEEAAFDDFHNKLK